MPISRLLNPTNQTQGSSNQVQDLTYKNGWSNETQSWIDQTPGIAHEIGSSYKIKGITFEYGYYSPGNRIVFPRENLVPGSKLVSESYPKWDIYHTCRIEDAKIKLNQKISTDGNPTDVLNQIKSEILDRKGLSPIEKWDMYFDRVDCLNLEGLRLYIYKYKNLTFNRLATLEKQKLDPENTGYSHTLESMERALSDLAKTTNNGLATWLERPVITWPDYGLLYEVAKNNCYGDWSEVAVFPSLYTFKYFLVDFGLQGIYNLSFAVLG